MKRTLLSNLFLANVFLATCAVFGMLAALGSPSHADDASPVAPNAIVASRSPSVEELDRFERHVRGGEFASAKTLAREWDNEHRDDAFARVARAQIHGGDRLAAAQTLREIEHASSRRIVFDAVQTSESADRVRSIPNAESRDGEGDVEGARGGGAFADFDSLMQLIQTTVAPDTWEALGGPSTMAPYVQGIIVDSAGVVREIETVADPLDSVASLERLLSTPSIPEASRASRVDAWLEPSSTRVVSLRRLRDEVSRRQLTSQTLSESMFYLAGLSELSHVVLTEDDVLCVGTVGGLQRHQGWWVDAKTGRHPLRFDFLVAAAEATVANRPFGCTIDPTPEGLTRAQELAQRVQSRSVPIGLAAKQMADALGDQRVEVFGTDANTTLGLLMVETDRHMKQLALGQAEMPDGVSNYLDQVDAMIASGPPSDVLIRLWFTSRAQQVQADADRRIFRLSGVPMTLSGQNERATQAGRARVADDPRTIAFVEAFNANLSAVESKYPMYGALESVYRTAAVAGLVHRFAPTSETRALFESLSLADLPGTQGRPSPKSVASIAVLHTVRSGQKRHHVLLASGGVLIDAGQSIDPKVQTYPTLAQTAPSLEQAPQRIDRWWWDLDAER